MPGLPSCGFWFDVMIGFGWPLAFAMCCLLGNLYGTSPRMPTTLSTRIGRAKALRLMVRQSERVAAAKVTRSSEARGRP